MEPHLSKKEKRKLAKVRKQREKIFDSKNKNFGKYLVFVIFFLGAFFAASSLKRSVNNIPGELINDLGRDHVPDGTQVNYNSNPPTSGPHFEEWVKAGIYDKPVTDGHLVHSLEHGYVILSYNCTFQQAGWRVGNTVFAHEEDTNGSPEGVIELGMEELPTGWQSEDCKKLVSDLTAIYDQKQQKKMIIIPRPALDSKIALTAWTRIDKFNEFDKDRIIKFIDAYRDKGPEKTTE